MTDKKIIFSSLVLAALLIGGGWYFSRGTSQSAAILPSSSAEATAKEQGIIIGNPDAPVVMEEYTNFLCPACARFAQETLGQIIDDYVKPGKVKLVIYLFPPLELGNAALCADEQGKFTEYHDFMFSHQSSITKEEDIKDFAVNAGLDGAKFNECYDSGRYTEKATIWNSEGEGRGVTSTPTFFINGQKFVGAYPYTDFKKIIEQKLESAK